MTFVYITTSIFLKSVYALKYKKPRNERNLKKKKRTEQLKTNLKGTFHTVSQISVLRGMWFYCAHVVLVIKTRCF